MKDIKFLTSAFKLDQLPAEDYPELILCGRSNVGKSSFINSLFQKKGIAKTSSTPGKTRSLNYYLAENKFFIVDLPGYGYAKVNKKEQDYWKKMIAEFITSGRKISLAFHLIDSRHAPTQLDMLLNEYLVEGNIPYTIILSKVDKLNQSELAQAKKRIREYFPEVSVGDNLFLYSATKGNGRKEIISRLNKLFLK